MLSTLDRWLLGRYLRAYAAFLGASLLLFTVIDGFSNVELLLRRGRAHEVAGASWPIGAALVERYGTMLPELFFVLSPHFVLVAGLWTAVALIRSRELVSLLAAGYSTARIATPMIAAACALSALTWADRDLLLPRLADLHRSRILRNWEAARPIPDGRGGVLAAFAYRPPDATLMNARFVVQTAAGGEARSVIGAQAHYDFAAGGWRFVDGIAIERSPDGVDTVSPLASEGLLVETPILPSDVEASIESPIFLSADQLRTQLRRTPSFRHLETLIYERYTQCLAGVALVLATLPIALGGIRGGLYLRVLTGLGLGVAYFLLTTSLRELGNRGAIEPVTAALLPLALFGLIGIVSFVLQE